MNCRMGRDYLSVFADMAKKRVSFATEGKDSATFQALIQDLSKDNGHPKSVTQAAIDMSPAYKKSVRQEMPHVDVAFDKFHVVAQINGAVDTIRRLEARSVAHLISNTRHDRVRA